MAGGAPQPPEVVMGGSLSPLTAAVWMFVTHKRWCARVAAGGVRPALPEAPAAGAAAHSPAAAEVG